MNDAELERIERIVASLAEDNKAAKVRQAALDKQLAELAEQNRVYALRLEEDRAEAEAQREQDRAERVKREEERVKREEERAKEQAAYEKRHAAYEEERKRERAETDKRLNKLHELFTGQWGKLVESLVEGELVRLFNERHIPVDGIAEIKKRLDPATGGDYQIDIIVTNGDNIVAVEVKTTLETQDVDHFIEKMPRFTAAFREYRGRTIMGAMAYLRANRGSHNYAAKRGLYSIRAVGNGATIINRANFKPRIF